jgi:DNA-binding PadR family transcriptional regulator
MSNAMSLMNMLKPLVIDVLRENTTMYGYQITQEVEKLSPGNIQLSYGAIYPTLIYLERTNQIDAEKVWVNNRFRIYYKLIQ